MVILNINKEDYKVFESWKEITVKTARELSIIVDNIPSELSFIYAEQAKGEDSDKDQIALYTKKLPNIQNDLDKFYSKVLFKLSDIPKDVISKIHKEDLRVFYNMYLMPFVFGVLHFPLEKIKKMSSFTIMGKTYYAPKSKKVMGTIRPFHKEDVCVFCDASDAETSARRGGNKYDNAELIVSIIFREKGVKHTDDVALEAAELFLDILTCDVYHAAISHLNSVNIVLKKLFPNMYMRGDSKASAASEESGLADFGWYNSIFTLSELQHFSIQGKTNLESVRRTGMYDAMTALSNIRATNDFQRIFREKINKK